MKHNFLLFAAIAVVVLVTSVLIFWLRIGKQSDRTGSVLQSGSTEVKVGDFPRSLTLSVDELAGLSTRDPVCLSWPRDLGLAEDEAEKALTYVRDHADHTSYLILLLLRRKSSDTYKRIPDSVKAAVFCAALQKASAMNDWGVLFPNDQRGHDGEALTATVEVGEAAINGLTTLLADRSFAGVSGSKEATASLRYQYRRADYAYRCICLIIKRTAHFDPDPRNRDKEIEELKKVLANRTEKGTS